MSEEESSIQEYFMTHKNSGNILQISENFSTSRPWIVQTRKMRIVSFLDSKTAGPLMNKS